MNALNDTSKKISGGKRVFLIFLSLLIGLATFSAVSIAIFRTSLSKGSLEQSLNKIDYTQVRLGTFLKGGDKDARLSEWIYEKIPEDVIGENDITVDGIDGVLIESDINSFIAGKIGDIAEDFYTNDGSGDITSTEITEFIEQNEDLILEKTGRQISDEDYQNIEKFVDKKILTVSISAVTENEVTQTVRQFTSYYVVAILGALSLILMALILVLLNRSDKIRAPRFYGGAFVGAGVGLLALAALVLPYGDEFATKYGFDLLLPLLSSIKNDFLLYGAITAVFGILLICLPAMLRKHPEEL